MSEAAPASDHELPIGERASPEQASGGDDEQLIARLVDSFYLVVRNDDLLGPIFMSRVADWDAHLSKMRDFWSTIVLQSGRYSGRPIQAHQRIVELSGEHFDRWLSLWQRTVEQELPAPARPAFLNAARRMARAMSEQLLDEPEDE